jgi:putative salt-induced outer membrane protein YdiY
MRKNLRGKFNINLKKSCLEFPTLADLQTAMPRSRAFLVIAFSLMLQCGTRAETLVLENGDRITGELLREEEGTLVFRSDLLGEIRAPAASSRIVTASDPTAISATPAPGVTPYKPQFEVTRETLDPLDEKKTDNVTWKRRIDVGLTGQKGKKDLSTYNVRLEAARESDFGQMNFVVNHRYGEANKTVYEDATTASAVLTRNVTDDLFWRGQTRYETDAVLGVDHSAEQSLGLGFKLFDGPRLDLDLGGGAAVRHREAYGNEPRWDGLIDAFGKLKFAFNERLTFNQDVWMTTAPTATGDFRLRSNSALVNKVTEMLSLSIRYEYEVLRTEQTEVPDLQRLVTAIGYVF